MTISKHARERFAERIMDKETNRDVFVYIQSHQEQIDERINKMVEFGTKIYTGISLAENNKSMTDVYINGHWVIIVDTNKKNVITLYEIDLGLGDDFNDQYIDRLIQELSVAKITFEEESKVIDEKISEFRSIMDENTLIINENRRIANELEKQNETYQELIDSQNTSRYLAEQKIRKIVGTMIGKKVF